MKLIKINKKYGDLEVLNNFDLSMPEKGISCLLGPSGCGKTTILNIIADLTDYDGKVEKKEKGISYIFQNHRLLPNLNVKDNLEYVLATVEKNKDIRLNKIDDILKTVELEDWTNYYPHQLSGGMQQRVAMARAFIYPSELLLMDEPFKGLDIALKKKLIAAFLKLWKRDNKTVVYVTHDVDEALLLSDKLVLLSKSGEVLKDIKISYPQNDRDLSQDTLIDIRKTIYNNF